MKRIKFLDLHAQYLSIKDDIDKAIKDVIEQSAFIKGPFLEKFENEFSDYIGTKHCIGVANGTDGLEIAIEALNLPKGSEIIVPVNSFISSAEAVTRSGHKVVFCDADPDTYTISVDSVKLKITSKTKAIIAVHLYGHPCEMDELLKLCEENNLRLIEDCAQAHGAKYRGKKIGGIGDIGVFSFYPGKNLGAYGDGGAVTTNNDALAKRMGMIANHGRIAKYDHEFEGRNSRLDGLQAAILSVKLQHLDKWLNQRNLIADYYNSELKEINGISLHRNSSEIFHAYHLYVIRVNNREKLQKFLEANHIETGIHYPIALNKLKAYDYLNQKNDNFYASKNDSKLLSLPIGEHLHIEDAKRVTNTLKTFFSEQ